jgi:hypothetical protein
MLISVEKDPFAEARNSYTPLPSKPRPVPLGDGHRWPIHPIPRHWLKDPETAEQVAAIRSVLPVFDRKGKPAGTNRDGWKSPIGLLDEKRAMETQRFDQIIAKLETRHADPSIDVEGLLAEAENLKDEIKATWEKTKGLIEQHTSEVGYIFHSLRCLLVRVLDETHPAIREISEDRKKTLLCESDGNPIAVAVILALVGLDPIQVERMNRIRKPKGDFFRWFSQKRPKKVKGLKFDSASRNRG